MYRISPFYSKDGDFSFIPSYVIIVQMFSGEQLLYTLFPSVQIILTSSFPGSLASAAMTE